MVASPTTYPGSLLPLRGLAPFVETDRDALIGRDADRDAVVKLITQEAVRAGLLLGEPGVGKTSFLRAGLLPHLHDHGIVPILCEDLRQPSQSFAHAVQAATHAGPKSGEKAIDYLARTVAAAMQGQLFVFIVDDVDLALRADAEGHLAHELGDLFARVATRSGGRARFLFASAESRMYLLDALERRTGSLFPPSARYHLTRFTVVQAHDVLEKTLALAGVSSEPDVSRAAAEDLGRAGMILPAELQIVARVIAERKLHTVAELRALGGATVMTERWIHAAADATGDRQKALRLLADLAGSPLQDGMGPSLDAASAAAQAGLDPEYAGRALPQMAALGLLLAHSPFDPETGQGGHPLYGLAHEVLAQHVRDLAVPASESARKARAALGTRAARGARLSVAELARISTKGIVPATEEEALALALSKRFYLTVAAGVVAVPLLFLIVIYILLSGTYHLSAERLPDGQRVVVRTGRPGLSAFWWLPHGPSFGSIVADTGFTPEMIDPRAWDRLADKAVVGDLDAEGKGRREFVNRALEALRPQLRGLLRYAIAGEDESALADLKKTATTPSEMVALLQRLKPVARGGPEEMQLVLDALNDPAPAVRRAALDLALSVARVRRGAYQQVIAAAMAGPDDALRRLAFAAARSLGSEGEATLLSAAMGMGPQAAARADLLAAFAAQKTADAASQAAAAAGILAAEGLDAPTRQSAWDMLQGAFDRDPGIAATHAARLAGDAKAEVPVRIRALQLLEEHTPKDAALDLAGYVESAAVAESAPLRAAALPLYARFNPIAAVGKLAAEDPDKEVRAATAAAWGELMSTHPREAEAALKALLDDRSPTVRAAAARAWGRKGKTVQDQLRKLIKTGGFEVAEGAAWGLAASIEAGGSTGIAIDGIAELWKHKGSQKRAATRIYGRIARTRPGLVWTYVASAARTKDDAPLRAAGVDGVCQALANDDKKKEAAGILRDRADDDSRDVRSRVAACVVSHPEAVEVVLRVAPRLAGDADAAVRADAARALAGLARRKNEDAGTTLVELVADTDRNVRLAAAEGLAVLPGRPPAGADETLRTGWTRADSEEKLVLLTAAQNVKAGGLVRLAAGDGSPTVRAKALPAVVALGLDVPVLLGAALTDADPEVRREALRLLGDPATKVAEADAISALEVATGDPDPTVAEAALKALASLEPVAVAQKRLGEALQHASEHERAKAARAAAGLVGRDPKAAIKVLEPVLADPAHDVRVAAVSSLGAAYAAGRSPAELAKMLASAEVQATRRLAIADALLRLAADPAGREAVAAVVAPVADKGPPMAKLTAQLVAGLAKGGTGPAFLTELIP